MPRNIKPYGNKVYKDTKELCATLSWIGTIKASLPLRLRGYINELGLFVQIKDIHIQPACTALQAGGKYRAYLRAESYDFTAEHRTWEIKKFDEITWDRRFAHLVGPTFEIALFLLTRLAQGTLDGGALDMIEEKAKHFKTTGEWDAFSPRPVNLNENDE